jgi:hypothetical protein
VEAEARAARLAKEVEETRNERQRLATQMRRADDAARQDIESLKRKIDRVEDDAQRKIDRISEEAKREVLKLEADRDRRADEVRNLKRELLEARKFAIGPADADQQRAATANAQQLQYGSVWSWRTVRGVGNCVHGGGSCYVSARTSMQLLFWFHVSQVLLLSVPNRSRAQRYCIDDGLLPALRNAVAVRVRQYLSRAAGHNATTCRPG